MAYIRSALYVAFAVVVAMALYISITFASIWIAGTYDNGKSADAIVVMGAAQYDGQPSPLLEARLTTALSLWNTERAPIIALTGGKQEGDRFTESEAGRMWLMNKGVSASSIVMETVGQSTWQSVEALAPVLAEKSITRVIVVSSDWHVGRTAASLEDKGLSVVSAVSTESTDGWDFYKWGRETVGVALGRIIGFQRLFSISG